jgi:DNA-damage-inducible protein J
MMATKQLATRVDEEQERLFRENTRRLGTTPADAMRMFVATFNECGGFPYDVRIGARTKTGTHPQAEPFATEQEAMDFLAHNARRLLNEDW